MRRCNAMAVPSSACASPTEERVRKGTDGTWLKVHTGGEEEDQREAAVQFKRTRDKYAVYDIPSLF